MECVDIVFKSQQPGIVAPQPLLVIVERKTERVSWLVIQTDLDVQLAARTWIERRALTKGEGRRADARELWPSPKVEIERARGAHHKDVRRILLIWPGAGEKVRGGLVGRAFGMTKESSLLEHGTRRTEFLFKQ